MKARFFERDFSPKYPQDAQLDFVQITGKSATYLTGHA